MFTSITSVIAKSRLNSMRVFANNASNVPISKPRKMDIVRKICEKSLSNKKIPLSAIYMFSIHKYTHDDTLLVKYGLTKSLYRRTSEHYSKYGPNIVLECHSFIDPLYLRDAEYDVECFLKNSGWHLPKNPRFTKNIMMEPTCLPCSYSRELAIIPISEMPNVLKMYGKIGLMYRASAL